MKQLNSRALTCLILAGLLMQMPGFQAAAQFDGAPGPGAPNLFDDELDEPVGTFNQAPPPPAPPTDFNNGAGGFTPPAGFPADNSGGFDAGSGLSTSGGRPGGMGAGSKAGAGKLNVKPAAKADPNKPKLADAAIEDITNENYGDLIESFDYPNADIADLVKAISQLTGKNFIIDPGVRGKISIVAPTQITVAEAYKAFLSALAINGFTVVPSGKFLKIKSARNAQRDSIETYSGAYYPTSDVMITRIIHLKHISAEEVNKRLRALASKDGDMITYEPTNTIIFTDYGTNIDRTMKIINELDKPGFEEQLSVMPIRYAKAKDLADLINQIINKDPTKKGGAANAFGGNPGFGAGVPSFRSRGGTSTGGTPEELSIVTPDDRTNAIIVVGNKAGIEKVRDLVRKLDYKLDPAEAGGVFVYYVKFGEAEKIAQTLNGVTTGQSSTPAGGAGGGFGGGFGGGGGFAPMRSQSPTASQSIFGGDVKIQADKNTNSLVITASKQDYDVIKTLLASLDIPRDQVFVEAIIMEMNTQKQRNWNPTYYHLDAASNGIGRTGFIGSPLNDILNPLGDTAGAVLGFGLGGASSIVLNGQTYQIPNLLAFLKVVQTNIDTNILSTPKILALDNETASIEVGDKIPISTASSQAANGSTTNSTNFEDVSIKLEITPSIRPDSEMVRMKIDQSVKQPSTVQIASKTLADTTTIISSRAIKTNLVVHNGDTAVLGGLVKDQDSVQESKIPLLGDIPLIGWLFKSRSVTGQKVNLVVFLTPKIIRNNVKDGHEILNKITNERIDWLKKNFDGRDPYGQKIDSLPRAAAADEDVMDDEPIGRKKRVPQSVGPASGVDRTQGKKKAPIQRR